jgi:hypothetical protein
VHRRQKRHYAPIIKIKRQSQSSISQNLGGSRALSFKSIIPEKFPQNIHPSNASRAARAERKKTHRESPLLSTTRSHLPETPVY